MLKTIAATPCEQMTNDGIAVIQYGMSIVTDCSLWMCTVCPRCGSDTADLYIVTTAQSSTLLLDGSASEEEEYYPFIVYCLGIQVLCWSVRNIRDRLQTRKCVYCRWMPLGGNPVWSVVRSLLSLEYFDNDNRTEHFTI